MVAFATLETKSRLAVAGGTVRETLTQKTRSHIGPSNDHTSGCEMRLFIDLFTFLIGFELTTSLK